MHQQMTISTLAKTKLTLAMLAGMAGSLLASVALAQNPPVTPGQKATAEQVAQAGVPLGELAADAPDNYTIKPGDTLWAISGLFLKSPWRWPELWGMNLNDIRNPHRIYPGQRLFLERKNGRATLRTTAASADGNPPTETIRLSPRTRYEPLESGALPAVKRANGRVATVAVNSFVFRNPVFVGDLLSFYAKVVKVGTLNVNAAAVWIDTGNLHVQDEGIPPE